MSKFVGLLSAFANNLFRLKVDVFMQKLFMKRSVDTPQEKFYEVSFWEKYSYASQNTYKASSFVFKLFSVIFGDFSVIISAVAIFVLYDPFLIIYTLLVIIIYNISTVVITNIQYKLSKKQIKEERISNYLSGMFSDKRTVKEMRIFGFSEFILSKWKINQEKYIKEKIKTDDKIAAFVYR